MSLWDILIPAGTALLGSVGGVLLGKHLKGKPPAPAATWDQMDADAQKRRDAKFTGKP